MQPEVDYIKIGQRIKLLARRRDTAKQTWVRWLVCSNNHMSHVEVGQTKVSLGNASKTGIRLGKRTLTIFAGYPICKMRQHHR